MKPKLLWVGDAGCPSGFALATHKILGELYSNYDVTVLGLNYRGDPHAYPYPLYTAAAGGDFFGVGRLIWMCDLVKPDVIVIQNDGWNIPAYVAQLRAKTADGSWRFPDYAILPVIAIVAVDGKNFDGKWLDDVSVAIFWTEFALNEARLGGYHGAAAVIPLGVDTTVYHPMDQGMARRRLLPDYMDVDQRHLTSDVFIVGNVNRNQPRKRWDLTIKYFAEWISGGKPGQRLVEDAWLFLHAAPTGDSGINVQKLARYYGVDDRLAFREPAVFYGVDEDELRDTYCCFDVNINTGQGEGMGLTALEAMACKVPLIAGDWSGIGDWAQGAAWLVPCTSTVIGMPYVNVIGGVPDEQRFIGALNRLYTDRDALKNNAQAAYERATEDRFRWSTIGKLYDHVLQATLTAKDAGVFA